MESQTGLSVVFFRTDNGKEFKNNELLAYLAKKGTQPEFTAPYQPDQNGAIERLHRTIWGLCRATMYNCQLPKDLWGKILKVVVFIWNRSPNSALANDMTPYEAWTGQLPNLDFLRRLGCCGYKLVPKALFPKKLDDWVEPCILVGYEAENLYRLWNPRTGAIERAKEVIFDENVRLQKTDNYKPPIISAMAVAPPVPEMVLPTHQLNRLAQRLPTELSAAEQQAAHIEAGNQQQYDLPESADDYSAFAIYHLPEELLDGPEDCGPELLPQPLAFLSDIQQQIKRLELDLPDGPPLFEKGQPKDLTRLELDAYYLALEIHDTFEPKTYRQAMECPAAENWKLAMEDEMSSLLNNKTWELVDRSAATNVLTGKWVYKVKRGSDGSITRYKARYVVRGFEQEYGIDYTETFASVVRQKTYRTLFALAAIHDWEIEQMDIKTAFLYGPVEETVFVELPEGYRVPDGKVCRLRKALYGLKQAPRIWFLTLSKALKDLGFQRSRYDEAVFYKDNLIMAIYVDDILIFGPDKQEISAVKAQLSKRFEMTDLGPCEFFLGTRIVRDRPQKKLWLSQDTYLQQAMERLDLQDLKGQDTPLDSGEKLVPAPRDQLCSTDVKRWYQSALGFLMFAMVGTRPDIAYAVSKLSRFMANPGQQHISAVKRVFRYIKATTTYGLEFDGNSSILEAWTDAEHARDTHDSQSTECYLFRLAGGVISWKSRKQSTVATSSCEAEYMALFSGSLEAVYLKGLLNEMGFKSSSVTILADNKSATDLVANPAHHERSKHFRIRFHKIRELQEEGTIKVRWTQRENNPADIGTKALPRPDFVKWRSELGVVDLQKHVP